MYMDYYDLVLGLVPLTLVCLTGLLLVGGAQFGTAVPVAGTVAAGVVGHALFARPPVGPRASEP